MVTRRTLLQSFGAVTALGLLGAPKITFANLPTDNRFILVILRGAMDGLAAVAPYGDRNYASARKGLALALPGEAGGVIDLDSFYGLNPALSALKPLYDAGQLAVIHAVASPYRDRSHFDAQNVLENGSASASGGEGWLNRTIQSLQGDSRSAIAINQQVPLVLQGKIDVSSWAPKGRSLDAESDFMTKIAQMYRSDPYLAASFAEAVSTQMVADSALSMEDVSASKGARSADQLYGSAKAAAAFLKKDDGPRIAVLEAGGWDTHARQGTSDGVLAKRLTDLASGLAALPEALGADVWNKTVVVVVTEFGRTVAENGTKGSDHGTGGVTFVMSPKIRGGQVYGDWPGLADNKLYQGRDLAPTTDMRSIFKTALYAHLGASAQSLDNVIFPGGIQAPYLKGLFA